MFVFDGRYNGCRSYRVRYCVGSDGPTSTVDRHLGRGAARVDSPSPHDLLRDKE